MTTYTLTLASGGTQDIDAESVVRDGATGGWKFLDALDVCVGFFFSSDITDCVPPLPSNDVGGVMDDPA